MPLPQRRPVEAKTQKLRDQLWNQFLEWLTANRIDKALFLETAGLVDVDSVNAILARYGRELYKAGRPYSQFSETLNAFTALVPKLRRVLQPAWDVAFAWRRVEPGQRHTAMPWQVLLACLAAALHWGWPRVAAILALTWGGLLRIGEALSAVRRDLLLPRDVARTADFALLSIKEPKTRFSAARHQSVKVDQPDLVKIIEGLASSIFSLRINFGTCPLKPCVPGLNRSVTLCHSLARLKRASCTWSLLPSARDVQHD